MGQDNSSIQRKPGLISEICNETLFDETEVAELLTIFEECANESFSLTRDGFQQALGKLEKFGLSQFKYLPMGQRLFDLFDVSHSGSVGIKEFFTGLSPLCKGSDDDKLEITFQVFDRDKDGVISKYEMQEMYTSTYYSLISSLRSSLTPPEFLENPEANKFQDELVENLQKKFEDLLTEVLDNILTKVNKSADGNLTKAEFKEFIQAHPFIKASYQLKFSTTNAQVYQDEEQTTEVLLSFLAPKK